MRNLVAGLGALLVSTGAVVMGGDQFDAPDLATTPAADIGDVFAWMSADATQLNLAMTVYPSAPMGTQFSTTVEYVFHLASLAAYGATDVATLDVICVFDAPTQIQCWAGNAVYLAGDPTPTTGLATNDGHLRVFAGLRDEPEFFNRSGFTTFVNAIVGAAGMGVLNPDAAGCPSLSAGASAQLVNILSTGSDAFAGTNTLALVVSLDKTLATAGGPIVSVWGSTHARP
jgi:hypothetical protein